MLTVNLHDWIVESFQICHVSVDFCKVVSPFYCIDWTVERLQVSNDGIKLGKLVHIIHIVDRALQGLQVGNDVVNFREHVLMFCGIDRPSHQLDIVKIFLDLIVLVFSVNVINWVCHVLQLNDIPDHILEGMLTSLNVKYWPC